MTTAPTEAAAGDTVVAVPGQCDKQTALTLTREIKRSVEQSWRLLREAFKRRAWAALGYDSWDSYCTEELGTGLGRLSKELRSEAVAELTSGERPMSNRAAAAALGVDESTVRADRRAGAGNPAPAPEREAEANAAPGIEVVDAEVVDTEVVDTEDAEVVDERQTEPEPADTRPQRRVVRGADGKNYVAPTRDVPPPAPRKRGSRRRTHQQVLEAMTASLTGIVTVLDDITDLDGSITRDEAAEFLRDLTQQVRALNRVKNLLKKYAEAADHADAAELGDVG